MLLHWADTSLEWSDGYGVRFGVTFTDYVTLDRTPKQSALLLKEMFDERMSAKVQIKPLRQEAALASEDAAKAHI